MLKQNWVLLLAILGVFFLSPGLEVVTDDFAQGSLIQFPLSEGQISSSELLSELKEIGVSGDELSHSSSAANISLPFGGFIQNLGQVSDGTIEYYYSSHGLSVGFSPSRITFVSEATEDQQPSQFAITFPGSDMVSPEGYNKNSHCTNYFYGALQLVNVPSWNELWYYDLYPGIDLRYYMSSQGLKYDFVVHPGADPSMITVQVSEPMHLSITNQAVVFESSLSFGRSWFQDTNLQVRQADDLSVSARFISKLSRPNTYGFQLGSYDPAQTLIIDPLLLSDLAFSTYLGGASDDQAKDIAVDDAGNVYLTGYSWSDNFPTHHAYQDTFGWGGDIIVVKLNAMGEVVFSTYLGGSDIEYGEAIAVDDGGNIFIVSWTESDDYPITPNAYQRTRTGHKDAVVTKLNATGTGIHFSTYLGGSALEYGHDIALDSEGNSYIVGYTESEDLPVKNAYQSTFGGGISDAFVAKLDVTGSILIFSTYLGGGREDNGKAIAVDSAGNSYVTGYTWSYDFPIKNAYSDIYHGSRDVFVTKVNAPGDNLGFSTYLGGGSWEYGESITTDTTGNCYLTGYTSSMDFPVISNAYQTRKSAHSDVFVTKLNATGNGLLFSTFLGGKYNDYGKDIVVDTLGHSYVTGYTYSHIFPITSNAFQRIIGSWNQPDVFVAKLNVNGTDLLFSSYLGGNTSDYGDGIAVDTNGNIYITGYTQSGNFPIENAYQGVHGGAWDCFVTKLSYFGFSYPTGGETLAGTVTIQWIAFPNSTGLPLTYSLYHSSDNGVSWTKLASNLTSTSYQWDTTTVPDSSAYLLRVLVTNSTGNTLEATTASPFTIQNCPTVIYPNGGEILNGTIPIQWIPVPVPSGVLYSVFYSPDAGTTWYALGTDLSATTYTWNTTAVTDGSNYLLKVIALSGTGHVTEDTSDNTFSIQNTPSSSTTPSSASITSSVHTSESGIPTTASPGWTIGIVLLLILTLILYREYKKRGRRHNKLYDCEG